MSDRTPPSLQLPHTASTASSRLPERISRSTASRSRCRVRSRPSGRTCCADVLIRRLRALAGPQRPMKLQPLGRAQHLAGQHPRGVGHHGPALARRRRWPSRRGPRGWPRSGSNRRWPGTTAALFSDTRAAASTCTSIMPELSPGCGVRKPGRPLRSGLTRFSTRRSLMLRQVGDGGAPAGRRPGRSAGRGSCRRKGPRPSSGEDERIVGGASSSRIRRRGVTWARASRRVPWTCGMQRRL